MVACVADRVTVLIVMSSLLWICNSTPMPSIEKNKTESAMEMSESAFMFKIPPKTDKNTKGGFYGTDFSYVLSTYVTSDGDIIHATALPKIQDEKSLEEDEIIEPDVPQNASYRAEQMKKKIQDIHLSSGEGEDISCMTMQSSLTIISDEALIDAKKSYNEALETVLRMKSALMQAETAAQQAYQLVTRINTIQAAQHFILSQNQQNVEDNN